MAEPVRIAMWSGPRNISTAMMYAFANRDDCVASDEPLYAHYLKATGTQHPGAAQVMAQGETDWRAAVQVLTGPPPNGAAVWYQKHMCHHILDGMDLDWLEGFHSCFLIRQPREVLLSLAAKTEAIDAWATGLPQQAQIVEAVRQASAQVPLIVDSADILRDPSGMLQQICHRLGIAFDPAMLAWPAGPKSCDGPWAVHWYDAVWASRGFAPHRPREGQLSEPLMDVLQEVQPIYDALAAQRLQP